MPRTAFVGIKDTDFAVEKFTVIAQACKADKDGYHRTIVDAVSTHRGQGVAEELFYAAQEDECEILVVFKGNHKPLPAPNPKILLGEPLDSTEPTEENTAP